MINVANIHMRCYYICLSGLHSFDGPCLFMGPPQAWLPGALRGAIPSQYHCDTWQKHRYRLSYGVIMEFKIGNQIYYCRSEVPDLYRFHGAQTPPRASPSGSLPPALAGEASVTSTIHTAGIVSPIDKARGTYRLKSLDVYNCLPVWTWNQIMSM